MRSSKQTIATIMVLAILIIPTLYLGIQVFAIMNRPYRTETAIEYDMSDSLSIDGYIAFEQVKVDGSGDLGYLVENGERVSVGTQIAEIYTSSAQAQSRQQLEKINSQIELLNKSENTSGSDVDVLVKHMQSAFYDLLDGIDTENYTNLQENANNYLLSANKVQIMTDVVEDFSDVIATLEQQKQQAEAQLGQTQKITASTGGYFVSAASGDFLTYTQDELDALSAYDLQEALFSNSGIESIGGAGKIVTSYTWRFYGTCSASDSKKFENYKKVNISFPGRAEKVLPATVEQVTVDEETGLAKIVLQCEYIGTDVLTLSKATAQIDFESYEGIRIDARALHIVDGEKGVYVKYGNLARWRKITVLYQDESYILVPKDGKVGTDNEVRLFDEIIVEGTDLKDGKILVG